MDLVTRREAAQQAHRWVQALPVYLDTETTGIGVTAEIIEIAILDSDGTPLFDSLVRPKGAIEPEARRVHGIAQADVQDAPEWAQVWPQVEKALSGRKIAVYNSDFDLRMLQQTHQRAWLSWTIPGSAFLCIMKLFARFHGEFDHQRGSYRWQSLENAGRLSGILLPNAHRAHDDALLARALLHYMADWQG
jgi:DNA polymerase-3 subunit epsilon